MRTNVIPKYPVIEKMNANPYAWTGFYKIKVEDNASVLKTKIPLVLISFDASFKCESENYHLAK